MTKEEYISEIQTFCKSNANKANVEKYSKFFKTEYVAYGLTHPQMHSKAKELVKNNELDIKTIQNAAKDLINSGMYEETTLLLLTIDGLHKQFDKSVLEDIEHYFEIGINNWAHADALGMFIVPKLLFISQ